MIVATGQGLGRLVEARVRVEFEAEKTRSSERIFAKERGRVATQYWRVEDQVSTVLEGVRLLQTYY